MYREITTVNAPSYEIIIPENLRGRKIEILAFEIENSFGVTNNPSKIGFAERTKNLAFNINRYKFDRNDANAYE